MTVELRRVFTGHGAYRRMGFINAQGEVVIGPRFGGGFDFSEGVGVVIDCDNGLMGSIDPSGDYVIEPSYPKLFPRADGYYRFSPGRGVGYLDERGEVAPIDLVRDAADFSIGIAAVRRNDEYHVSIINKQGDVLARSFAPNLFLASEGLVPFCDEVTERFGFLNTSGDVVIEPRYEFARPFSEGVSAVLLRVKGRKVLAGFVARDGSFREVDGATRCESFREGLSSFSKKEGRDELCGVIDASHRLVVPPIFALVGNFAEGLAPAKLPGGKWGFIGRNGYWLILPAYDDAESFRHGLAEVRAGAERFYLDPRGRVVWREAIE